MVMLRASSGIAGPAIAMAASWQIAPLLYRVGPAGLKA
jgi:hypothetical protein